VIVHAGDDVGEVGLRIEAIHLGGLDDGHGPGQRLGAGVGSGEQPVTSSDSDRPQGPFRSVVVDGDAAIIEIDTGGAELRAFALASAVETGERVRVIGHPDGRFYSLTEGIVSRVFTETADEEGKERRTWITVTADYGSGSSGAPVLNAAGEVVGMVSSTAALLADTEQDKEPKAEDVQMVFRDCVSADTIRRLIAE
jgi:hypothetical protein